MTIEDYNELKLQDELMIGYEVEEDLPDEYEDCLLYTSPSPRDE